LTIAAAAVVDVAVAAQVSCGILLPMQKEHKTSPLGFWVVDFPHRHHTEYLYMQYGSFVCFFFFFYILTRCCSCGNDDTLSTTDYYSKKWSSLSYYCFINIYRLYWYRIRFYVEFPNRL